MVRLYEYTDKSPKPTILHPCRINNSWKTDHGMKRIHLSSCSGHSNDLRAVLSDDSVKASHGRDG